jgi:hypothetical protein
MRAGRFYVVVFVGTALAAAVSVAAPPDARKPATGNVTPAKIATPTPLPALQPIYMAPCSASGTVSYVGTSPSQNCPSCVRFQGAMTVTANLDLYGVRFDDLYVMYKGGQFAICGCASCPRYWGDAASSPPSANVKKGEVKSYAVGCIFVDPKSENLTGPFTIPVSINYFTLYAGKYTAAKAPCGELALIR